MESLVEKGIFLSFGLSLVLLFYHHVPCASMNKIIIENNEGAKTIPSCKNAWMHLPTRQIPFKKKNKEKVR